MKQNRNFAKPDENSRPIYAPTVLRVVTHHHDEGVDPETGEHWERDWDTFETKTNPTASDYAQMGYLPVVETPPADPAPDGYHYEPRGWEVHRAYDIADEDCIRRVWEIVADPPPPPRRWTRLSVKCALADAHLLPAAQSYLTELLVKPDYPAWAALSDCDYIEEGFGGDEAWNALLDGAAQALGKTREEIDAFLAAIPTEGGAA